MVSPRLSKSQYVKGRKCGKRLWLYRHHPERESARSPLQEGILEQGREVGELARSLYPQGELIAEDPQHAEAALQHTREAIAGGASVLFEAAFEYDNILIRADIVTRDPDGRWNLIEVKSSSNARKVRKEHLFDLAIQKYVMTHAGLPLASCRLLRLNREYRKGESTDLAGLFAEEWVDAEIEREFQEVEKYVGELRTLLQQSVEPEGVLGAVCKNPFPCEFKAHCWGPLPANSIHYLSHIRDLDRAELLSRGIKLIPEIPEGGLLRLASIRHWECETRGEPAPVITAIKNYIDRLQYPLYFLDFETYGYAIPRYPGTHPYQRLPFQFSLHIQESPGGPITHREFLATTAADPRRALTDSLLQGIGPRGSVIVYYAAFEGGVLEELAEAFPECAERLLAIRDRLWDLEVPFRDRWIARRSFQGKSSIKFILPAMVPELSYEGLYIKAGDQAAHRYFDLIDPATDPAERERVRLGLLQYCQLDTWAMVAILEKLRELVKASAPSRF